MRQCQVRRPNAVNTSAQQRRPALPPPGESGLNSRGSIDAAPARASLAPTAAPWAATVLSPLQPGAQHIRFPACAPWLQHTTCTTTPTAAGKVEGTRAGCCGARHRSCLRCANWAGSKQRPASAQLPERGRAAALAAWYAAEWVAGWSSRSNKQATPTLGRAAQASATPACQAPQPVCACQARHSRSASTHRPRRSAASWAPRAPGAPGWPPPAANAARAVHPQQPRERHAPVGPRVAAARQRCGWHALSAHGNRKSGSPLQFRPCRRRVCAVQSVGSSVGMRCHVRAVKA